MRVCAFCGEDFEPNSEVQITCGTDCRKARKTQQQRERLATYALYDLDVADRVILEAVARIRWPSLNGDMTAEMIDENFTDLLAETFYKLDRRGYKLDRL